jgi:8-oxo-dGTP pyrophosphatase MutT (NUDIX family)
MNIQTKSDEQVDPRLTEIRSALYRISAKAIITKDNRVLLVCEKESNWWGFPGGGIDYGETIQEALIREVGEELGVTSENVKVDDTAFFISLGAIVDGVPRANIFYRVTVPVAEIRPTEDVLEQKWYSLDELPDLYLDPCAGNVIGALHKILQEVLG